MKVIEKKDNFFSIAVKSGERMTIADDKGVIILSVVASEDCLINAYRKIDFAPLEYHQ